MRILCFLCVVYFLTSLSFGGTYDSNDDKSSAIPLENQTKGERPSAAYAVEMSKTLLKALIEHDYSLADTTFFPADTFNVVKGIKDPAKYYKTLIKWFHDDVKREADKLKNEEGVVFDKLKMGYCKWKKRGSEANAVPYWSCYRNRLYYKVKGKEKMIEVRVIINWGKKWYVTHLGPIPKK